jgi:hypothetical protein
MRLAISCALLAGLLAAGCRSGAEGPLKGVLLVYPQGMEEQADSLSSALQIVVATVDPEPVFAFSYASEDELDASLERRRTILFLCPSVEDVPDGLERVGSHWAGSDRWALDQAVFAAVPGVTDASELSTAMQLAYDAHLRSYLYRSFVSTGMSSPERIDSLRAVGFSMDVPRSYRTAEWRPEDGFIQFQRTVSDEGAIMISIRWTEGDTLLSAGEAVLRREAVARRFFYDAGADSVDRSRLDLRAMSLGGLGGWRLLGAWRNPEHLNAGAFTSYVLQSDSGVWVLDTEVFNPGEEKEPFIREGWIIMNTFSLEG